MRNRRRTFAGGCRVVLAWSGLCYLIFQAALIVVTDTCLPELRDPEYGHKLSRLRERLAEEPGHELIVILGSSRAGYGFRPEALRDRRTPDCVAPIVFNFGLTGAGPILEFVCLQRLL